MQTTSKKSAAKNAAKKLVKAAATPAKKASEPKAAAPVKTLSDVKQKLNAAFISKMPQARPVFQAKFKPLALDKHSPNHASERDEAFIYALKSVYGANTFTQRETGADSGNLARAVNLGRIKQAGKNADGDSLFKIA